MTFPGGVPEKCGACSREAHDECSGWCFCECQPAVAGSGSDPGICPSCGKRPKSFQCAASETTGACVFTNRHFPAWTQHGGETV